MSINILLTWVSPTLPGTVYGSGGFKVMQVNFMPPGSFLSAPGAFGGGNGYDNHTWLSEVQIDPSRPQHVHGKQGIIGAVSVGSGG